MLKLSQRNLIRSIFNDIYNLSINNKRTLIQIV